MPEGRCPQTWAVAATPRGAPRRTAVPSATPPLLTAQNSQRVDLGAWSSSVPSANTTDCAISNTPYGGGPAVGAPYGASNASPTTTGGQPYFSRYASATCCRWSTSRTLDAVPSSTR